MADEESDVKHDLETFERDIEQQMGLLAGLSSPAPSADVLTRVQAGALAEADRVRRLERWRTYLRPAVGIAAAVVLAVVLLGRSTPPDPANGSFADPTDPVESLSEWADAFEESAQQLAAAVDETWTSIPAADDEDAELRLEDALESLDRSLMDLGA